MTIAVLPEIVDIARASCRFLVRAVRYPAANAGIRQFLDVGTGIELLYPDARMSRSAPG